MSSHLVPNLNQPREAKVVPTNNGTASSFNNHGSSQPWEADKLAAKVVKTTNHGTANSFNNRGNGNQDFSNARINSGAYSGDRNRYRTSNNYDGRTVNNSGTFNGNGNGGFIDGNFDASTRNYNYKY